MAGKHSNQVSSIGSVSVMHFIFYICLFPDPYDDDLKVKTQRPRSADQPGVFQAQTGE